jgi:precorrin-6Y C5,15-methyltransferase (decarboxylating)
MTAWLNVIGVGERGVRQLPDHTRLLLRYAETVIGPPRFLNDLEPLIRSVPDPELVKPEQVTQRGLEAVARALLDDSGAETGPTTIFSEGRTLIEWEPPIDSMIAQVLKFRNTPTVILATGDPMWYGIGATMSRHLGADEFAVHPFPSSFQLAAGRLHWPLQHVTSVSLHGRPVEAIHPHVLPGNRILALAADRTTIDQVVEILVNRGYGRSRVITLENLGAAHERLTLGVAESFDSREVEDFYIIAIECAADPSAPLLASVAGLPDEAFVSDGQLTKREIRAATIARLAPYPGALLWDVGAGCGSIGIEWMRAARDATAIAFEEEQQRLQMIGVNAAALGVPGLEIVAGEAPATFEGRLPPDAVFMGADVGNDALFDACWAALKPGGRLVANAVTLESEQALYRRQERLGGDLARIEISLLDRIGSHRVLRPRMAVVQWSVVKPSADLAALL